MERLDKLLSQAGFTRKDSREAVRQGRVTVDGCLAADPGMKCAPQAEVRVDGVPIQSGFVYLMLHKPAGVLSATRDARQKTVLDLLPPEYAARELFPVGRLDVDTTGLLLLTDDGPLAHRLLSPRHHVDKVYEVRVDGVLGQEDVEKLAAGLVPGDGLRCLPAGLELTADPSVGLLTLQEGKFHQVKRMMAALGKPVTALKRLSMGGVALDPALPPGMWRELTAQERNSLGA